MPFVDNSVKQENIQANNVAGRDVNHNERHYHLNGQSITTLWEACERLRANSEKAEAQLEGRFIESLAEYMADEPPLPDKGLRTLADKITSGRCDIRIDRAVRLKDKFARKLERSGFNELVQNVYAIILSEIRSAFEHRVKPLHVAGKIIEAKAEIFEIYRQLDGQIHGSADITKDDLEGMLYYLAGKCHVDWDS